MGPNNRMSWADLAGAIVCVGLWGVTFPLTKYASMNLAPLMSIAFRLTLVAVLAGPFYRWPRGDFLRMVALSSTLFAIPLGGTAVAIVYVDSSIAALMTELEVVFAAVLSAIFLGERLTRKQVLGLVFAFFGVYLVVRSPEIQPSSTWALIMLLGIAFCYGWAAVQIRYIDTTPLLITIWGAAFAAPQVWLLSWFLEADMWRLSVLESTDQGTWWAIFFMAISTVVTFYLWNFLIKKYSVTQIVPFGMLVPVTSLIAAYFLLGEQTHYLALIGGAITIVGVKMQVGRRS